MSYKLESEFILKSILGTLEIWLLIDQLCPGWQSSAYIDTVEVTMWLLFRHFSKFSAFWNFQKTKKTCLDPVYPGTFWTVRLLGVILMHRLSVLFLWFSMYRSSSKYELNFVWITWLSLTSYRNEFFSDILANQNLISQIQLGFNLSSSGMIKSVSKWILTTIIVLTISS